MYKVGICGSFSYGRKAIGGQTIRTRVITDELIKKYGQKKINTIDSDNWKKNPVLLFVTCIKMTTMSKNIIILPAHNGIKVFIPLFVLLKSIFNRKLHYVVIGAWLADDLSENKWLIKYTKKIDVIYVATNTLKKKLSRVGIDSNVRILPNFRTAEGNTLSYVNEKPVKIPLKACILSRINKMKGINDAVDVINKINNSYNDNKVKLDIYGPIEKEYESEFKCLLKKHSTFLTYKGIAAHSKTIETLQDYHLLLFPTKYYTEGFPGTILDAYFSGLPVLASRWESSSDIIDEGITGVIYEFDDLDDFTDKLVDLIQNPSKILKMRKACINKSQEFLSENAMKIMVRNLG
jgi:glycosyltransferase involved in cell wall biosynthesis